MRNRRIGLIGRDDDPEVELLKQRIEDLGATATVLDFSQFPRFTLARMTEGAILYDDIDLTALDAFYLRRMGFFTPLPPADLTEEEWAAQYRTFNTHITERREIMSFTESVVEILGELKPLVNPYEAAFYHKLKVFQYWVLARSGLEVPEFLAANDFFALKEFLGRVPSVVKPLVGGIVSQGSADELDKGRDSLRKRPILLQRQIAGRMLRSFVLGGRLLGTCETVPASTEPDSRSNIAAMKSFQLGPDHEAIPVRACEALGMIFAGVDLILDEKTGKLYVLECNPAPFFRNFEAQSGLPLSRELARYLVEEATK